MTPFDKNIFGEVVKLPRIVSFVPTGTKRRRQTATLRKGRTRFVETYKCAYKPYFSRQAKIFTKPLVAYT